MTQKKGPAPQKQHPISTASDIQGDLSERKSNEKTRKLPLRKRQERNRRQPTQRQARVLSTHRNSLANRQPIRHNIHGPPGTIQPYGHAVNPQQNARDDPANTPTQRTIARDPSHRKTLPHHHALRNASSERTARTRTRKERGRVRAVLSRVAKAIEHPLRSANNRARRCARYG
jgi:hypothetical protein